MLNGKTGQLVEVFYGFTMVHYGFCLGSWDNPGILIDLASGDLTVCY